MRRPNRIPDKKPPHFDVIFLVQSEPVIDSRRQNDQIPGQTFDPDPFVVVVPHVEIPGTGGDEPDFLVGVNVLGEEVLDLVLVVGQRRWRDFQPKDIGNKTSQNNYSRLGL